MLSTNLTSHMMYDHNGTHQNVESIQLSLKTYFNSSIVVKEDSRDANFTSKLHGNDAIPLDRAEEHLVDASRIDRVYFDFLGNLGGFELFKPLGE
jgi:hypothetical protein